MHRNLSHVRTVTSLAHLDLRRTREAKPNRGAVVLPTDERRKAAVQAALRWQTEPRGLPGYVGMLCSASTAAQQ